MNKFEEEPVWNKKRVFIVVGIFVLILLLGITTFKDQLFVKNTTDIQGASTEVKNDNFNQMSSNISGQFQDKVEAIKNDVNSLDVDDVASS